MGVPKHKHKSLIPQHQPHKIQAAIPYLNKDVAKLEAWMRDGDSASVFVSLRYVQHDFQCFSEWEKQEMNAFWDFMKKIHDYDWTTLYSQSRKTNKAGMGYTVMSLDSYPNGDFKRTLDPTITIFELRVNEKSRVHCFRNKSVCYVCWLDRNHEISP